MRNCLVNRRTFSLGEYSSYSTDKKAVPALAGTALLYSYFNASVNTGTICFFRETTPFNVAVLFVRVTLNAALARSASFPSTNDDRIVVQNICYCEQEQIKSFFSNDTVQQRFQLSLTVHDVIHINCVHLRDFNFRIA